MHPRLKRMLNQLIAKTFVKKPAGCDEYIDIRVVKFIFDSVNQYFACAKFKDFTNRYILLISIFIINGIVPSKSLRWRNFSTIKVKVLYSIPCNSRTKIKTS